MNKHLKIAFVVAPFLAIGGYALVDQYQHHQLQKQARALFPLAPEGDCRLASEAGCRLRSETLDLLLREAGASGGDAFDLLIESDRPLVGGKLGYGAVSAELPQRSLRQLNDGRHWAVTIPRSAIDASGKVELRMVLVSDGRVHIATLRAEP